MKNKKIKIIWHNGGELANQLWGAIGIYAYCHEKGYKCVNNSFFFYKKYFKNIESDFALSVIFEKLLPIFIKNKITLEKVYNKIYLTPTVFLKKKNTIKTIDNIDRINSPKNILKSKNLYLPPTKNINNNKIATKLKILEKQSIKIFFHGWLFRNPLGIIKHRKKILKDIEPVDRIQNNVNNFILPLREKYNHLVGIHIRQGDYKKKSFKKLYFSPQNIIPIMHKYKNYKNKNICFIICSDEQVDLSIFTGLNVVAGPGSMVEDLFTLAKTDIIIGSNSTYGAFASFYGNIPHIIFSNNIDWEIYEKNNNFFENRLCTTVSY